ncbi:mannosyl-oligosaccharide 1,2-alpha-mannosidase precursor [Decorospora gaudefroyi]|uniref:alpha-1,2-Mannosidase n=1 Tax=Decorospora gaudefroyi TaxID=184978 RepID=A0A6A5K3F4_9PLEO|nr:mannosyl-oligosaccharide 1,2-alpha-mannosidase precursor [Decorospora gaudefroyi]
MVRLAVFGLLAAVASGFPSNTLSSGEKGRRQYEGPPRPPQPHETPPYGIPPPYETPPPVAPLRAQAVVDAFKVSWDGYYEYAFPMDELMPVSNNGSNSRNGWGASAIDALSTALLMNQTTTVHQMLTYIPTINWTSTDSTVSLFETTIRYLGGLLSAYDLLTGPLVHLVDNTEHVDALLTQAMHLANNLSYAFETPSGVPWNNLIFSNRTGQGATNGLATVGTLILEWVRLSDLTGNTTYANLVQRAESYLLSPSPSSSEPFPGLVGSSINVTTGLFTNARGGWGGGTDSFYEYLIKMYVYDDHRYEMLKDRWIMAADSSIKYLASRPVTRQHLTFLARYNGTELILESSHLACFHGGNFILGGTVLERQDYVDFGLELVRGCHATYTATATGIGPEAFSWNASSVPTDQLDFFHRNGFYIKDAGYQLRPEVIESYYYAYRATGDAKYQDWAWDAFLAINATTRVGSGYSSIEDVDVVGGGNFTDFQESFWFAEVLKYSYLIQAGEAEWQVVGQGNNEWVFNTEAHPVKVFGGEGGGRAGRL